MVRRILLVQLASLGADEIRARMEARKIPALHLVASDATTGFSKIGGSPEASPALEWPSWNGKPMAFLAQIDLAELGGDLAIDGLPATGSLYFFYDQEQSTWGFDPKDRGSWRVLYLQGNADRVSLAAPKGLAESGVFGEKRVAIRHISSFPSLERLLVDGIDVSPEVLDEIEGQWIAAFGGAPQHQIGGFPSVIQGDSMELECQLASHGLYCGDASGYADPRAQELGEGSADWRLLLQLDSDDDIGMMWGDCGMLYFWVRAGDLRACNFAEAWMVLQCS